MGGAIHDLIGSLATDSFSGECLCVLWENEIQDLVPIRDRELQLVVMLLFVLMSGRDMPVVPYLKNSISKLFVRDQV